MLCSANPKSRGRYLILLPVHNCPVLPLVLSPADDRHLSPALGNQVPAYDPKGRLVGAQLNSSDRSLLQSVNMLTLFLVGSATADWAAFAKNSMRNGMVKVIYSGKNMHH